MLMTVGDESLLTVTSDPGYMLGKNSIINSQHGMSQHPHSAPRRGRHGAEDKCFMNYEGIIPSISATRRDVTGLG